MCFELFNVELACLSQKPQLVTLPEKYYQSNNINLFLILGLLTAVNCLSVRWAMQVQSIFTTAKLAALAAIVIAGLYYLGSGKMTINITFVNTGFKIFSCSIMKCILFFLSNNFMVFFHYSFFVLFATIGPSIFRTII
jgi:amino acid transporter